MRRRKNIFVRAIKFLLGVTSVVFAVLGLCVVMAGYINPQSTVIFAYLALGAPIIYLGCTLLLVVWVIRWSKGYAILMAIPIVMGFSTMRNYIQIKWTEQYDTSTTSKDEYRVKIISYNTHNMGLFHSTTNNLQKICETLSKENADIVCLQEFSVRDSSELEIVDRLFDRYPYRIYQNDPTASLHGYSGIVIISKYPLENRKTMSFEGTHNGYVGCDLIHLGDTIRLFCTHLQTTSVSALNHDHGLRNIIQGDSTRILGKKMFEWMSHNFQLRSIQADSLRADIERHSNRVIVAGDFNSPAATYTYRTVRGTLSDAFTSCGSGYGTSYIPILGMFRIDYVLYNDDMFECLEYSSPKWSYSDHRPIIVTLKDI